MTDIDKVLDDLIEDKKDDFLLMIESLEKKIKDEGEFTGLCLACLGTDYEIVKKGHYTGIECIKNFDEDVDEVDIQMKKCFHGDIIDESGFQF